MIPLQENRDGTHGAVSVPADGTARYRQIEFFVLLIAFQLFCLSLRFEMQSSSLTHSLIPNTAIDLMLRVTTQQTSLSTSARLPSRHSGTSQAGLRARSGVACHWYTTNSTQKAEAGLSRPVEAPLTQDKTFSTKNHTNPSQLSNLAIIPRLPCCPFRPSYWVFRLVEERALHRCTCTPAAARVPNRETTLKQSGRPPSVHCPSAPRSS